MTHRPWAKRWSPLVEAAGKALKNAKGSPRLAAVVEDGAGGLHVGVTVAVRDLPSSSLCAEQIAVARSRMSDDRGILRIVVVGPAPKGADPPCGRCLQVLLEFGGEIEVRWGTIREQHGRGRVKSLLPHAFVDYRQGKDQGPSD